VKGQFAFGILVVVVLGTTWASAQYRNYGETQQFDVGFGVGTLFAPSYSLSSTNHSPQSLSGGTYLAAGGDYLFWHHLGVQGEVAWRASQGFNVAFQQPYRPILYDFNAIYAPPLGSHAQLELLGGLGAITTHFYVPYYTCSFYSCQNYYSSSHFMGDLGVAVRFYVSHGIFLRPEFRQYFINNNIEYSSAFASRLGVTLGYSFGH